MRQRFFLIYNSAAGRSSDAVVTEVERELIAGGASVVRCKATSEVGACSEATIAARSGDYDALIAAGGDGTIRLAAVAARGTQCPLAAIMVGTGNVLAHELRLPRSPGAIVALLRTGRAVPVEMGLANGEPFLLMVGAGLDARILQHLNQSWKRRLGKTAFGPAVVSALAAPLDQLQVDIDGQQHTCAWAIVTNASHYGSNFRLTARTSLLSPGLVAILFHSQNRRDLAGQLAQLALGGLDRRAALDPGWVSLHPCTQVRIDAQPAAPVQIDGDLWHATPLVVTRGGGQVSLIVPDNALT